MAERSDRCCATCRDFVDDAASLERELVGLTILSSAQGDTRGDQGLCRRHDRLLLPTMFCSSWRARFSRVTGVGA